MDCLNHALYSYAIVVHICYFDNWRNIYKKLVLISKSKMRWCKTFSIVYLENSFLLFFLFWHPLLFSHFFDQKLLICIHLRLFMHTIQNNTFLSSSIITYWNSGIFFVKVQSALCWWNTRPLSLNEFLNYYKLYQGTAQ